MLKRSALIFITTAAFNNSCPLLTTDVARQPLEALSTIVDLFTSFLQACSCRSASL